MEKMYGITYSRNSFYSRRNSKKYRNFIRKKNASFSLSGLDIPEKEALCKEWI